MGPDHGLEAVLAARRRFAEVPAHSPADLRGKRRRKGLRVARLVGVEVLQGFVAVGAPPPQELVPRDELAAAEGVDEDDARVAVAWAGKPV